MQHYLALFCPVKSLPRAKLPMYYVRTGDDKKYDYFLSCTGKYPIGVISFITSLWNLFSGGSSKLMSPEDMFYSMGTITNWQEVIAPWLSVSLNGGGIYQNIQYAHQPSVLLSLDGELHWSVVYGCDRTTFWTGWTNYSFWIWDNGTILGNNYDSYHAPYKKIYREPLPHVNVSM